MNNISLKINGKKFTGWTRLQITQGIEQVVPSFSMAYTDKYPGAIVDSSFKMGEECQVEINGHRLLSGHIEEIQSGYDATNHNLEVRGRDKLGDLVDCSYYKTGTPNEWHFKTPASPNEWKGQSIINLATILCDPFNIRVEADLSVMSEVTKVIPVFKLEEGETAFAALARLVLMNAILIVGYGDGKLTLTRAAKNKRATTSIESGRNIFSARVLFSNINRFSNYVVKGVGQADDIFNLTDTTSPFGSATDELITRHRPTVIFAEDLTDNGKCQKRAEWSANVAAGKSREYKYTLIGWLQEDGSPWPLNGLVKVKDTPHNVNKELLIQQITYDLSNQGQTITLTLIDPRAYELTEIGASKIADGKMDIFETIRKLNESKK